MIYPNQHLLCSIDGAQRRRLGIRFKPFLDFPRARPVLDGALEAGSRTFGTLVCDFMFEAAEATTQDDVLAVRRWGWA